MSQKWEDAWEQMAKSLGVWAINTVHQVARSPLPRVRGKIKVFMAGEKSPGIVHTADASFPFGGKIVSF